MKATLVGAPEGAEEYLASRLAPLVEGLGEALGVPECTLAVLLTDDDGIRVYNQRFRGVDEPTDVLSFPSDSGSSSDSGHNLGDLIISLERARLQAAEIGHSVEDEMEVLVLHGVLHLLGHDHETDDGEMRALEARLAGELLGSLRGLCDRGAENSEP